MRTLCVWLHRLQGLVGTRRRERELAQELESHLQLHIDDNIRAGMSPEEARRAALVRFGPLEAIKEDYRDRSTVPAIETVLVDLRYAARMLRRRPALTLLSVATLALGVGAAAAMFGVVDALMFRPPRQVHQPERVVEIEEIANYARYVEIAPRLRALDLAAFTSTTVSLGVGPDAFPLATECVTPSYFPVLGTSPVLGRAFVADDEQPDREPGVIIGHDIWQKRFGGERAALGRAVTIANRTHTIIGVAPPGFTGLRRLEPAEAWILLVRHPEACTFGGGNIYATGGFWLNTIARIRDGFTRDAAQADAVAADINPDTAQFPRADGTLETRRLTKPPQLTPVRYSRGNDGFQNRLAVWLAAGAAVLLLIACANVAGLLAMRAVERRREIAVRLQLGASRLRVFVQLLQENVVIAGLCALAAVGIASWIAGLLEAFYPLADVGEALNPRTAGFLAIFSVLAALISGIVPAAQAARADIASRLRTTNAAHERGRFRTVLLVIQVALALVLIVGAGLFVRSVGNFRSNLAYDLDRVIVASVDLGRAGFRDVREIRARYDRLLDSVRQLPEVQAAAYTTNLPAGTRGGTVTLIAPDLNHPAGCCHALVTVTPDYFETLGIRILRGRSFTDADARRKGPGAVILDEGLAKQFFPNPADAVGRCLFVAFSTNTCREVVGISESARRGSLRGGQLDSEFFLPFGQSSDGDDAAPRVLLARPRTASAAAMASIATAIRNTAVDLPYVRIEALQDLADEEAKSWRLGATIFGLFGMLAVVLSGVGIYAALAFSMRQRTGEIGVRMALGADAWDIARIVAVHALIVVAAGWALGGALTAGLTRYVRSLLFDVAPGDATTFITASLLVAAAALGGCIVPAIRASRIDPAVALRTDWGDL